VLAGLLAGLPLLASASPARAHTDGALHRALEAPAELRAAAKPPDAGPIGAPAAVTPPAPRRPSPRPVDRSADALGVTLALAAAILAAGGLRARPHARRLGVTATALLLLGFVLESAPHLAHHALDPDHGSGCRALQLSERSPAVAEPGTTPVGPSVLACVELPAAALPAVPTWPVSRGRAPPA
jgi:hypothetical protein